MDNVQLCVIIGVAVALLTLLVYLISVFGTRSKTYEETMEEQRKRQIELFGKPASESDKKKEKKPKKAKKTKSEKQATGDAGQVQEEEQAEEPPAVKMLNLEIEPQIIDDDVRPSNPDVRKRKRSKPILHNRDEKSPVSPDMEVEEMFHPQHTPRDDVEVKHERERRMSGGCIPRTTDDEMLQPSTKSGKKNKKAKDAAKPEPVVAQEVIQAQAASVVQAEPPRKSGKKGKNSPSPDTRNEASGSMQQVVNMVDSGVLSDTDIQRLVDILLAKQGSRTVDWTKKSQKGDPVNVLNKKLQENEKLLKEEQERAEVASRNVQELRQQLQQQQQQIGDKLIQREKELGSLKQRMTASQQQSLKEVKALQEQLAKASEENKQLKAKQPQQAQQAQSSQQSQGDANLQTQLRIMSDEMAKNGKKIAEKDGQITQLQKSKTVLEQNLQQSQQQFQEVSAQLQQVSQIQPSHVNDAQVKQLEQEMHGQREKAKKDLEEEKLRRSKAEEQLAQQNEQRHTEYTIISSKVTEAENELFKREKSVMELQKQLMELQNQLCLAEQFKQEQMQELQTTKQENSRLHSELKKTSEQHQRDSAQQPNLQTLLHKKESEIRGLQSELGSQQAEITKLKDDLEAQRKKNNESIAELESKSLSQQKDLVEAREGQKEQVQAFQEQVRCLEAQLSTASSGAAPSEAPQPAVSESEISQLKEEIEKLRAEILLKDNDLQVALSKATGLDEQLKNTKNDLETKSTDIESLAVQSEQRESAVLELREKLAQSEQQLTATQSQLEQQLAASASAQQEKATVQQGANKKDEGEEAKGPPVLNVQAETLQQTSPAEVEELCKLRAENSQYKAKEADYLREIQELKQALQDSDVLDEMSCLRQRLAEKESEVQKLNTDVQTLKPCLDEYQSFPEKETQWKLEIEELQARLEVSESAARDEAKALHEKIDAQAGLIDRLNASLKAQSAVVEKDQQASCVESEVIQLSVASQLSSEIGRGGDAKQEERETQMASTVYSPFSTGAGPGLDGELQLKQKRIKELETQVEDQRKEMRKLQKQVSLKEEYSPISTAGSLQETVGDMDDPDSHRGCDVCYSPACVKTLTRLESQLNEAVNTISVLQQKSSEVASSTESNECVVDDTLLQYQAVSAVTGSAPQDGQDARGLAADQTVESSLAEMGQVNQSVTDVLRRNAEMLQMLGSESSSGDGLLQITSNSQVAEVGKQSGELEKQLAELQQQLNITRKENDELRAGCEKATAALTAAESAAEEIAQVQKELSSKVSEVTSLRDAVTKRDRHIAELQQKQTKTANALAKAEKLTPEKASVVQSSALDSELQVSNSKLLSQVQHYKTVLADTEGILNKLQTSVETEEKKWHSKVRVYEQELQATKAELNRIKAESEGSAEKIRNGTGSSLDEADEAVSAATEAGMAL